MVSCLIFCGNFYKVLSFSETGIKTWSEFGTKGWKPSATGRDRIVIKGDIFVDGIGSTRARCIRNIIRDIGGEIVGLSAASDFDHHLRNTRSVFHSYRHILQQIRIAYSWSMRNFVFVVLTSWQEPGFVIRRSILGIVTPVILI